MPSHSLLKSFQQYLVLDASWVVNGQHYGRTCNAWLKKMDDNIAAIRLIFQKTCCNSPHFLSRVRDGLNLRAGTARMRRCGRHAGVDFTWHVRSYLIMMAVTSGT